VTRLRQLATRIVPDFYVGDCGTSVGRESPFATYASQSAEAESMRCSFVRSFVRLARDSDVLFGEFICERSTDGIDRIGRICAADFRTPMTAGRKVNAHAHARAQQTQSARTQTWSKGPIYCLRALSKLAMAARAYDYLLVSMCDVRYVYSMQRARQIYERMPLPNECAQRSPLAVAPLTLNGSVGHADQYYIVLHYSGHR
jgi:hypothetical protein